MEVAGLPKEASQKIVEDSINERIEKILQVKTPEHRDKSKGYSMNNSRNKQTD